MHSPLFKHVVCGNKYTYIYLFFYLIRIFTENLKPNLHIQTLQVGSGKESRAN
jgi:hypothetical protein